MVNNNEFVLQLFDIYYQQPLARSPEVIDYLNLLTKNTMRRNIINTFKDILEVSIISKLILLIEN